MGAGGSNQLIDVAKAAAYLDMKPRKLRDNWRPWGIPVYRVGRELRFRVRDLDHWADGNREAA